MTQPSGPDSAPDTVVRLTHSDNEDISSNHAAHLEQEERAEVMRYGSREAILRARERAAGRKRGQQQPASDTPVAPLVNSTEPEGEDRVVMRQPDASTADVPEPFDRVIDRNTQIDEHQSPSPPEVSPPVPAAESAASQGQPAETKFESVPEIRPDVELPRLRTQFRLPGQRTESESKDANSPEMSTYDRVLQQAQAYRATNMSQTNRDQPKESETTDDVVTSTSGTTWQAEEKPLAAPIPSRSDDTVDDADDEVVAFQVDRSTRFSRFAHDIEYANDELDDTALDEDYELDRSFRPEPPPDPNQSGHRWWHTFARAKVFRTRPEDEPSTFSIIEEENEFEAGYELPAEEAEPETESSSGHEPGVAPAPLRIEWDNASLAPANPPATSTEFDQSAMDGDDLAWSTLDYLEADKDPTGPLEPMVWRLEEPAIRDTPAPNARHDDQLFNLDLSQPAGMDRLRDRLFGQAARPPSPSRQPVYEVPDPDPDKGSRGWISAEPSVRDEPLYVDQFAEDREIEDPFDSLDYTYDSEFNPDYDLRRIVSGENDPLLDMTIEIAPETPRKCATCRSFRVSDNSERGWCTNNWAFPHQPLVNSEDLACDSTMGCWWLPIEDTWQADEYLAQLAQATPRVDRLEAALRGDQQGTRRSG